MVNFSKVLLKSILMIELKNIYKNFSIMNNKMTMLANC
jgi:hypothetical protein